MFIDPFLTTATIFILVIILIFLVKPHIFFEQNDEIKSPPLTLIIFIYGSMILTYILIVCVDILILSKHL